MAHGDSHQTAFVGETGLTGTARLTEFVALRAGYRLLWVDGVALASQQLAVTDFNSGNGLVDSGDVFYHGAFLGAEIKY